MTAYWKVPCDHPVPFAIAGEFVSDTEWTHMLRSIGNFELILGVEGTVYIREEETCFEVGPGDMVLLRPGVFHGGYRMSDPGVKFHWVHFDLPPEAEALGPERMREEAEDIQGRADPFRSVRHVYLPRWLKLRHPERVHILFRQLLHTAHSQVYSGRAADYLLTSLLIELSEQVLGSYSSVRPASNAGIPFTRILEWTRIHALEPLSVADIARKFNYNQDYLTRLFKLHTRQGPLEYIRQIRIGKAKELLYRTGLSVKEVAAEAGFVDEKYMMRLFRKHVHMTPTEFRSAYNKTFMNNV